MLRKVNSPRRPKAVGPLLAVLSAILLVLSFPNFNLSFLAWIAFVPLLLAIGNQRPRTAFLLSYLCGVIFFLGTGYWLIHVTLPGMIAAVLFLALYFGIFGSVAGYVLHIRNHGALLFIPALWVAVEWLRSNLLTGFGWALLAHSQAGALPVIQVADITGAYGTSFLVMLINAAIFITIRDFRTKAPRAIPSLAVAVIVLYVSAAYGTVRIKNIFAGEELKVSVVQGNIPQSEKWDPDFKNAIIDKYERLTKEAAKDNPDLIVWPESSMPGFLSMEKPLSDRMKALSMSAGTNILIGAPREEDSYARFYNSALLFSGEGRIVGRYDKIHLVPFGEYIPFKKIFSFAEKLTKSQIGDFSPGTEYKVFKFFIERRSVDESASWKLLKKAKFSCLICFEDIFPDLSRQFVKNGANFLVNITNDAWYGRTGAPYQHMQCSVFRAVENRVNVVRAANTGISCFIDQKGRITDMVESGGDLLFVDGIKTCSIILTPTRTFYTVHGDIFAYLCMLYVFLFIVYVVIPTGFGLNSGSMKLV